MSTETAGATATAPRFRQEHGRSTPSIRASSSTSNTSASPPSRACSGEFEGTLDVGPEGVSAYGTVKVDSVDTREPQRDGHLRSPDFFDAEQYPEITFKSTAVRPIDDEEFEIEGDFTIHGVTRQAQLKATSRERRPGLQGDERVGVSATAQINRSDYDMKFNMALGSGNVVVSDKVKILLEISAVKA